MILRVTKCVRSMPGNFLGQHPDPPVVDGPVLKTGTGVENIQGEHVIHQLGDRIKEGVDLLGIFPLIGFGFTETIRFCQLRFIPLVLASQILRAQLHVETGTVPQVPLVDNELIMIIPRMIPPLVSIRCKVPLTKRNGPRGPAGKMVFLPRLDLPGSTISHQQQNHQDGNKQQKSNEPGKSSLLHIPSLQQNG